MEQNLKGGTKKNIKLHGHYILNTDFFKNLILHIKPKLFLKTNLGITKGTKFCTYRIIRLSIYEIHHL